MYFDFEFARDLNPQADGDDLTRLVVEEAKSALCSSWLRYRPDAKQHMPLAFEILTMDSHSSSKWSRHVVLSPFTNDRQPVLLCSTRDAGALAQAISNKLPSRLEVRRQASRGDAVTSTSFLDTSVYSRNRLFRLIFSSKLGPAQNPTLTPCVPFSRLATDPGTSMFCWLANSLVVPPDSSNALLLEIGRQDPPTSPSALPTSVELVPGGCLQYQKCRVEERMALLEGVTCSPLLDLPMGTDDPFLMFSCKGSGMPPWPRV